MMQRLKWWFLLYGAFFTLLGAVNVYSVLIDPAYFASNFSFGTEALQAFVDGWSPFAFEVLGIGLFCLWASRNPLKYTGAVWLLVFLELMHGVFDDIYLISRGYSAAGYVAFIAVHFLIIGTGIWAVRSVSAETEPAIYRPSVSR
jgi:hypothetical protein